MAWVKTASLDLHVWTCIAAATVNALSTPTPSTRAPHGVSRASLPDRAVVHSATCQTAAINSPTNDKYEYRSAIIWSPTWMIPDTGAVTAKNQNHPSVSQGRRAYCRNAPTDSARRTSPLEAASARFRLLPGCG